MAKVKCRGTTLKIEIATVLTTIAQVLSMNLGKTASMVLDVEALDDAGAEIDKLNLGTVEQEDSTFQLFYDPALAAHQGITDMILAPSSFPLDGEVTFPTTPAKSVNFTAAGMGFGVAVANRDVLKGDLTVMHSGALVWPS